MTSPRHLLLPALGVVALAGCGGSSDPAPTASAAPAATTQAAAAPAAAPTAAKTASVTIKDFEYGPAEVTVATGGTVSFENLDTANHTVTLDAGAMKSLGNQRTGVKRSMRFAKAGTYAYHCDFHPNMHGTVVVK